jgi:hypothetical protein
MICPECGARLPEGLAWCPFCGRPTAEGGDP